MRLFQTTFIAAAQVTQQPRVHLDAIPTKVIPDEAYKTAWNADLTAAAGASPRCT